MRALDKLPPPRLDALPLGAHRLSALTDQALFDAAGVRVVFAGRAGGVSEGAFHSLNCASHVGDDPRFVRDNRQALLLAAGVAGAPLVALTQVHGTGIHKIASSRQALTCMREARAEGRDGPRADAVVTAAPGVAALLSTADCLPLMVVSPSGRFVLAHAGWRGALARIAGKAVCALAAEDPFAPACYNAYIGPHIRSECFEVSEEVARSFAATFGTAVTCGRQVSLARAVIVDLEEAGIDKGRVADAGICTCCQPKRYFSYRASGGVCGRNATLAVTCR